MVPGSDSKWSSQPPTLPRRTQSGGWLTQPKWEGAGWGGGWCLRHTGVWAGSLPPLGSPQWRGDRCQGDLQGLGGGGSLSWVSLARSGLTGRQNSTPVCRVWTLCSASSSFEVVDIWVSCSFLKRKRGKSDWSSCWAAHMSCGSGTMAMSCLYMAGDRRAARYH